MLRERFECFKNIWFKTKKQKKKKKKKKKKEKKKIKESHCS